LWRERGIDRILPKDRPVKIDLPPIEGRSNLVAAYAAIMKAVGAGEITPSEGSAVAALLASNAKFIDDVEFDARLRKIEEEFNYRQAKS
jgi:hypothetical protein